MEDNGSENIKTEPNANDKKKQTTSTTKEKKKNTKEEKSKKKDERYVELVLKSLCNFSSFVTTEDKLIAVCKKFIEIHEENRKLLTVLKHSEKKSLIIQKEKEQCEAEKSKILLAKDRLESLCRELQKQNKAIKDESISKMREEEEKRKEVSAKFQSTLTEITSLMAETNEKNVKLHTDNIEIHNKFKSVFDEMDMREQHFEEMHKMMKQELKLAETKLAKVTLEMTEEKETLLKEKSQLLLKLTEYQTKIRELQTVEANLRSQVEMYTEKYSEFQNVLCKSNEVFGGFSDEMEKLTKKITKAEKDTKTWKERWEKSQIVLIEMASEKQARDALIANLNKKSKLLEDICHTLQKERSSLFAQIKETAGKSDSNDQIKSSDKIIEDIQNISMNEVSNQSASSEIEKTTKELEAELSITNTSIETIETNSNEIELEKNLSTKVIENNDNETINTTEEKETEKNSLECEKENNDFQVPVQVEQECAESIKSLEINLDNSESVIVKTFDITENMEQLQLDNKLESHEKKSVTPEIKDAPDKEISHATNKKNKDGKKKKK